MAKHRNGLQVFAFLLCSSIAYCHFKQSAAVPVWVQRTWRHQKVQQPSPPPAPELSCSLCGNGLEETLWPDQMMVNLHTTQTKHRTIKVKWPHWIFIMCLKNTLWEAALALGTWYEHTDQHGYREEQTPGWHEVEWPWSEWEDCWHWMASWQHNLKERSNSWQDNTGWRSI